MDIYDNNKHVAKSTLIKMVVQLSNTLHKEHCGETVTRKINYATIYRSM